MKKELISQIIQKKNGIIKLEEIIAAGITKTYFYEYAEENKLEKVAPGIYVTPDTWEDPYYILQLRCPQAIFSHESALYLWDMAEREPLNCPITLKKGYNSKYLKELNVRVHCLKPEIYDLGVTTIKTPYGNMVNVFNRERTICDIVRDRSRIEIQDFQVGFKEYIKCSQKDIPTLMNYAKVFRIEKILRTYLEVLL